MMKKNILLLICFLSALSGTLKSFEAHILNNATNEKSYTQEETLAHAHEVIQGFGYPLQGRVHFTESSPESPKGIDFKCNDQGEVRFGHSTWPFSLSKQQFCVLCQTVYFKNGYDRHSEAHNICNRENCVNVPFSNSQELALHVITCHAVHEVACPVCGGVMSSHDIVSHCDTNHLMCMRKQCLPLDVVFATADELEMHKNEVHKKEKKGRKLVACLLCLAPLGEKHKVDHYERKHLMCVRESCGNVTFPSRKAAIEHKNNNHKRRSYKYLPHYVVLQ